MTQNAKPPMPGQHRLLAAVSTAPLQHPGDSSSFGSSVGCNVGHGALESTFPSAPQQRLSSEQEDLQEGVRAAISLACQEVRHVEGALKACALGSAAWV